MQRLKEGVADKQTKTKSVFALHFFKIKKNKPYKQTRKKTTNNNNKFNLFYTPCKGEIKCKRLKKLKVKGREREREREREGGFALTM